MHGTRTRALELLGRRGFDPNTADALLAALEGEGVDFADTARGEFVCRWVNVADRGVPPQADTIIRTVTRTQGEQSFANTHWLEGLEAPPFSAPR